MVEAVAERYHFGGIGEQMITPLVKLQVPGALGGQDVHYSLPIITDGSTPPMAGNDHLLPWVSLIHLYPGDCWIEIPSMVTTPIHVFGEHG